MTTSGKTEAGSAGMQPRRGIAWRRLIENDARGRLRSSSLFIGFDRSPHTSKIPALKGRNLSLTQNARSPIPAEPRQLSGSWSFG